MPASLISIVIFWYELSSYWTVRLMQSSPRKILVFLCFTKYLSMIIKHFYDSIKNIFDVEDNKFLRHSPSYIYEAFSVKSACLVGRMLYWTELPALNTIQTCWKSLRPINLGVRLLWFTQTEWPTSIILIARRFKHNDCWNRT